MKKKQYLKCIECGKFYEFTSNEDCPYCGCWTRPYDNASQFGSHLYSEKEMLRQKAKAEKRKQRANIFLDYDDDDEDDEEDEEENGTERQSWEAARIILIVIILLIMLLKC